MLLLNDARHTIVYLCTAAYTYYVPELFMETSPQFTTAAAAAAAAVVQLQALHKIERRHTLRSKRQ